MYNKAITEFGFCNTRNNQGLGNEISLDLDYSGYKILIQLLFITTSVSNWLVVEQ